MLFGIREKVALLVVVATAASALIVARMMVHRATEILREHEIVDLGDEASLRGWVIVDQIDGLRDDLINLAFSPTFYEDVVGGASDEQLFSMARGLCRRYWKNHLRIEVVSLENGGIENRVIAEKGSVDEEYHWFPDPDARAGPNLHVSPIQRLLVTRTDIPEREAVTRWEPVIWAVAPLDPTGQLSGGIPVYVRIMMSLHGGQSPRHLFAMETMDGEQLVRHDEMDPEERGNDEVFLGLRRNEGVVRALEARRILRESPVDADQDPKVYRLARMEHVPLNSMYYFQEGTPGKRLERALAEKADLEVNERLRQLRTEIEPLGRVGGLQGGVREVRMLSRSREDLNRLREIVESAMETEFPAEYDRIHWRAVVECDEIHTWSVKLTVGDGGDPDEYLIHYAVLDDELASAIEYEMKSVRNVSLIVAGVFGVIGFLMAMHFIRPLKEMTRTAQTITGSHRKGLYRQVAALAKRLENKRRDEIGEIARASRRLFEELLASQVELESRVDERTQELRRANTDLEKANEKLMSLSHEKDSFVAKVSHDLRQPLNAIFLQVEALKLSDLDEGQKRDIERIHAHATRELNLVNDILEYQKIIMGAETLSKDEIEIPSLLEDLVETFRPNLRGKEVTLECRKEQEYPRLVADERRVRQLLGNLIGNACKFTKNGTITVEARAREISDESWIEFTVTDTGRGMSPEEQAKVFVPFVSNKQDNAGGSGLGLSICKELTVQMGGRIGFVSELGKGTHFSVFLPIEPSTEFYEGDREGEKEEDSESDASRAGAEGEDSSGAGFPGSRDATVLVIDDDGQVRSLLKRLLSAEGYRVITAENGDEGLKMANEHLPDAITLDVVMPGGKDGWEVLHELKDTPSTQSIPVVMISVMAEQESGMTLDVEDYLVKPVNVERLKRVIQRATGQALQRNLLLVDDDRESLEAMSRVLEESGWQTILAGDGTEALDILSRTRPAAIVLDLIMPGMDGFEFLHQLESSPHLSSIPVIVVTGKIPDASEQEFLHKRVETVVMKGNHAAQDLVATIRNRIKNRAEGNREPSE